MEPLSAEVLVSATKPERKPAVCHLLVGSDVADAGALAIQLSRQLRSDFHFKFVCLGESGPTLERLGEEGENVQAIHWKPGLDWSCSRRLERVLRRERVDLLHAHQPDAFLHGMLARLFYRRPPVLFTAHARQHPGTDSIERVLVSRMLLEGRDQVIAASRSVRRALILNQGLPPERVGVIYNGIVPPSLASGEPELEHAVRREISVDLDALLIILIAGMEPAHRDPLAIRVLEEVVRKVPGSRMAVLGDGPDAEILRESAQARELESHVLFPGSRADYSALLAAADVVLVTDFRAGMSPLVIQALAAGRPVVATKVGGISELVTDRVCGLLARPGDSSSLAQHIVRLSASPELREHLGQTGRQRIESLCERANTSALYLKKYRNMLGR